MPVYKTGATDDPSNYRGISLINVMYKIFSNIVYNRLCKWANLNNKIAEPQAGFRKGYSTIDNLYAIPTAEVPITNMYRDVILREDELPIKNVGYTPCFRREAGSYGSHVRGLNRLHQFDKVEIVQISKPENSYEALEGMLEHVKGLMQ